MTHYTAYKVGVRVTDRYQMLGQVGHYRLSVSVRFAFGGTYGFGRVCYFTFGPFSVLAESKTSAFGRPLLTAVLHCRSQMNASDFGVKRSKFKVIVEQNMLEEALSGWRHTVLDI